MIVSHNFGDIHEFNSRKQHILRFSTPSTATTAVVGDTSGSLRMTTPKEQFSVAEVEAVVPTSPLLACWGVKPGTHFETVSARLHPIT
jgi:hypothetical protein